MCASSSIPTANARPGRRVASWLRTSAAIVLTMGLGGCGATDLAGEVDQGSTTTTPQRPDAQAQSEDLAPENGSSGDEQRSQDAAGGETNPNLRVEDGAPASPGEYTYSISYDGRPPKRETREVSAGSHADARTVETPVSGVTDVMRWSAKSVAVIESRYGPSDNEQVCTWDRPIEFIRLGSSTWRSQSKAVCTVAAGGDGRTRYERSDVFEGRATGQKIELSFVTELRTTYAFEGPAPSGVGDPSTLSRFTGNLTWDESISMPVAGTTEIYSRSSTDERTVRMEYTLEQPK